MSSNAFGRITAEGVRIIIGGKVVFEVAEGERIVISARSMRTTKGWKGVYTLLDSAVQEQELSTRVLYVLEQNHREYKKYARYPRCKRHPSKYLGDVVQMTDRDLLKIEGFGRKMLKYLDEDLSDLGLQRGMDIGGWVSPDERK